MAVHTVNRDRENLHATSLEFSELALIEIKLLATSGTPIEWIKNEHDRLATVVRQAHELSARIRQREIRRSSTGGQRRVNRRPLHFWRMAVQIGNILNIETIRIWRLGRSVYTPPHLVDLAMEHRERLLLW